MQPSMLEFKDGASNRSRFVDSTVRSVIYEELVLL